MAYYIICFLWTVVFVATLYVFIQNKLILISFFSNLCHNLILLTLIISIIVIAISNPFHGLEYEDAYEYLYSSNHLAYNSKKDFNGLNPICILGSSKNVILQSSLSHPAGYSVLLSLLIELFGFGLFLGHICSIIFFLIGLLFLYIFGQKSGINGTSLKYGIMLVASSPLFLLFGISSFSETASSFLIIFFILQFQGFLIDTDHHKFNISILRCIFIISTFILAILVRRENIGLIIPSIIAMAINLKRHRQQKDKLNKGLLIGSLFVFSAALANFISNQNILNFDIVQVPGAASFSLEYFWILFPKFMTHTISPTIFGTILPILLLSFFLPQLWNRCSIIPFATIFYILLCLTFAHSYYFIYSKETPTIHFERYLLQIWPLIVIHVSTAIDTLLLKIEKLSFYLKRFSQVVFTIAFSSICIYSLFIGCQRRHLWSNEESSIRYLPYKDALNTISKNGWIVTGEPILIDLWSEGERNIIDYGSLGRSINNEVLYKILMKNEVYLFLPEDSVEKPEQRYRLASLVISKYRIQLIKKYQFGNQSYNLSKLSLI